MVKIVNDNRGRIQKAVESLLKSRCIVGIAGDQRHASANGKGTISTAVIGYINEFGDEEMRIPPRPFIRPGIASVKDEITKQMEDGARQAFAGDLSAADQTLHKVGLIGQSAIKGKIISGPFAPLSERTLEARARRRTESGTASRSKRTKDAKQELANRAAGMAPSSDLAKPLIDTGELLKAINYAVRIR